MDKATQLWGIDDIAAALDVTSDDVERWRRSGDMPPPTTTVNLGTTPIWRADDIISWSVTTGRTRKLWRLRW